MLFVIGFGVAAGAFLPLLWAFRTTRRQVYAREVLWPARRPLRLRLMAEFLTSALLVVSAIGIAWRFSWAGAVHVLALGMLLHSLLRSSGDFIGCWPRWASIALISVLLGGTLTSFLLLWGAGFVVT